MPNKFDRQTDELFRERRYGYLIARVHGLNLNNSNLSIITHGGEHVLLALNKQTSAFLTKAAHNEFSATPN